MSDTVSRLAELWTELLDTEDSGEDADFFDCGGTSISAVHLAALIQENLSVAIDAIEVVKLRTLGRISETVVERLAEA